VAIAAKAEVAEAARRRTDLKESIVSLVKNDWLFLR